jgi:hypothetical protein
MGVDLFRSAPDIIERNRIFVANKLKPLVNFVEEFRKSHGRLPSLEEFNSLLKIPPNEYEIYVREDGNVPIEIREMVKDLDWSNDYVIAIWRGEWFEFYISEGKRYITNDFDYVDAIRNLIITIGVGLLPLIGMFLYDIRYKKGRMQ